MELMPLLKSQAVARDLLEEEENISPEKVFTLVRDMKIQPARTRSPVDVLTEWQGTAATKHYLLDALLSEMGYETQLMMCTHKFIKEQCEHFPHWRFWYE